ncbi:MAG: response regulator [Desulfobacterales bacterium]
MLTIFIVDDNRLFSETLKEIIVSAYPSAVIREFPNGEYVMTEIESESPNLIFMDINLPGSDGLVLTRSIKEKNSILPVVVITNYDSAEYTKAAIDAGADYFISKNTITINEIINLVGTFIDTST